MYYIKIGSFTCVDTGALTPERVFDFPQVRFRFRPLFFASADGRYEDVVFVCRDDGKRVHAGVRERREEFVLVVGFAVDCDGFRGSHLLSFHRNGSRNRGGYRIENAVNLPDVFNRWFVFRDEKFRRRDYDELQRAASRVRELNLRRGFVTSGLAVVT